MVSAIFDVAVFPLVFFNIFPCSPLETARWTNAVSKGTFCTRKCMRDDACTRESEMVHAGMNAREYAGMNSQEYAGMNARVD